MSRVLLDTGPLVALLASDDRWHAACCEQLRSIRSPLITTWPVLAEADWLLRSRPIAIQHMLEWVRSGVIEISPSGEDAAVWIAAFLRKYARSRPQLADASLVYAAERESTETILTVDRRDFSIYRFGRNRSFRILPE